MTKRILISALRLASPNRQYNVEFRSGVNLITGPISTGKSSILKLIDYVLGAKQISRYPEISKCLRVYAEFLVGGETFTISRSLVQPTAPAKLFLAPMKAVFEQAIPDIEIAVRHSGTVPSISTEFLNRLEMGGLNIKTAPTQDASETSTFSLRDLITLVYVGQDRIGADSGFFENFQYQNTKFRAAFEIVNGIFHQLSSDIGRLLLNAEAEEKQLASKLLEFDRFLTQSQIPHIDQLDNEIRELKQEEARVQELMRRERDHIRGQLGENLDLTTRRDNMIDQRSQASARVGELQRMLGQLGRLRVTYERERAQLEFLQESEALISGLPVVRCPSCLQQIEPRLDPHQCYVCTRPMPPRSSEVAVEARLRSIQRKIGDLTDFMEQLETQRDDLKLSHQALDKEISAIDWSLHRLRETAALPDTRRLMELDQELSKIQNRRTIAVERLALRRNAQGEGSNLEALRRRIRELRENLDAAREQQESSESVLAQFSTMFAAVLESLRFPNKGIARVDPTSYLPIVRDVLYSDLSSKGAMSLAMLAWHFALLFHAIDARTRFPRLLMLDAPMSHVGHDSSDADFKDQKIVDAFYGLVSLVHEHLANECQIIICDPRPPTSMRHLVSVEFTGEPGRGRYGLIDDEPS